MSLASPGGAAPPDGQFAALTKRGGKSSASKARPAAPAFSSVASRYDPLAEAHRALASAAAAKQGIVPGPIATDAIISDPAELALLLVETPYCLERTLGVLHHVIATNDAESMFKFGSCIVYLTSFVARMAHENAGWFSQPIRGYRDALTVGDAIIDVVQRNGQVWAEHVTLRPAIDVAEGSKGIDVIPGLTVSKPMLAQVMACPDLSEWANREGNKRSQARWDGLTLVVTLQWCIARKPTEMLRYVVDAVLQDMPRGITWVDPGKPKKGSGRGAKRPGSKSKAGAAVAAAAAASQSSVDEGMQGPGSDSDSEGSGPADDGDAPPSQDEETRRALSIAVPLFTGFSEKLGTPLEGSSSRRAGSASSSAAVAAAGAAAGLREIQWNEPKHTAGASKPSSSSSSSSAAAAASPKVLGVWDDLPSPFAEPERKVSKAVAKEALSKQVEALRERLRQQPSGFEPSAATPRSRTVATAATTRIYFATHVVLVLSEFGTRPILAAHCSQAELDSLAHMLGDWLLFIAAEHPVAHHYNRELAVEVAMCLLICKHNGIVLGPHVLAAIRATAKLLLVDAATRGAEPLLRRANAVAKENVYLTTIPCTQDRNEKGAMFANYHTHYLVGAFFGLLVVDTFDASAAEDEEENFAKQGKRSQKGRAEAVATPAKGKAASQEDTKRRVSMGVPLIMDLGV